MHVLKCIILNNHNSLTLKHCQINFYCISNQPVHYYVKCFIYFIETRILLVVEWVSFQLSNYIYNIIYLISEDMSKAKTEKQK